MTDVPDYRGRIERDQPQDLLHKIAGIIPGYKGYQDLERRRDADKELRMFLARRYREQQAALTRAQQQLARTGQLNAISEVERLNGVLQRFIDKLETATQGYAGLFDPIKVQGPELDQLYTFDAALAEGVQKVSDGVQAVTTAAQQGRGPAQGAGQGPDLQSALSGLERTLDDLLTTWTHRNDVIVSGRPMPADDFNKFRANVAGTPTAPLPNPQPYGGQPGGPPPYPGPQPYGGQPGGPGQAQGGQPGSQGQSYGGQAGGAGQPYGGAQPPAYGGQPGGQSQPAGGQPSQPYSGPQQPPAYGGQPGGQGQPYQPYSGPQEPAGMDSPETARLRPPSDVSGGPTGGPADEGPTGSGQ